MVRVWLFTGVVSLAIGIYALVDCLGRRDHQLRVLPKVVWLVLIAVFPLAGPGAYLLFGRTTGVLPKSATPRAPDDDDEFLRQVRRRAQQQRDEYQRQQRDKLIEQWQADHETPPKSSTEPNTDERRAGDQ